MVLDVRIIPKPRDRMKLDSTVDSRCGLSRQGRVLLRVPYACCSSAVDYYSPGTSKKSYDHVVSTPGHLVPRTRLSGESIERQRVRRGSDDERSIQRTRFCGNSQVILPVRISGRCGSPGGVPLRISSTRSALTRGLLVK